MRFRKILLLIWACPLSLFAQRSVDTLSIKQAAENSRIFEDSVSLNALNLSKQSAFFLKNTIPARFNRAGIDYQFLKGDFITVQDANQIQAARFSTEGSSTLGKMKLYGNLLYSRVYEDSTAYAHQTRNNPTTPYYFGAPAAIHYERTYYAFQALAGRSYLNDRLDAGLGLDYRVGSHFSTNDPRGSLQDYQFDMHLALGYQINKQLKLGFAYGHGYGREAVNIGYKNPRYYESSAFPEYYNHLVNGYREWDDALKNRVYDNKFLRNQIQAALVWNSSSIGNIKILLKLQSENQDYFLSNNSGFTDLAYYELNTTSISLAWEKVMNSGRFAAFLNWKELNGKDKNTMFQANNYLYYGDNIDFKLFFAQTKYRRNFTYSLSASQRGEQRIDGISGNNVAYQKLWTELGFSYIKNISTQHSWGLSTGVAYQFPLSKNLQIPLATGSFTQDVILHDFQIHQANLWSPKIDLSYMFPAFKSMQMKAVLESRYIQQLSGIDNWQIIEKLPLQNRFVSKFSLNLYF